MDGVGGMIGIDSSFLLHSAQLLPFSFFEFVASSSHDQAVAAGAAGNVFIIG
jgi:hypothetical protein